MVLLDRITENLPGDRQWGKRTDSEVIIVISHISELVHEMKLIVKGIHLPGSILTGYILPITS